MFESPRYHSCIYVCVNFPFLLLVFLKKDSEGVGLIFSIMLWWIWVIVTVDFRFGTVRFSCSMISAFNFDEFKGGFKGLIKICLSHAIHGEEFVLRICAIIRNR